MKGYTHAHAVFDADDDRYRYMLLRGWSDTDRPRLVMFVGLNPSTATAMEDDPTIRRCVGFAKDWGFDRLAMLNLFALRATDPRQLLLDDPWNVGSGNDTWLRVYAARAHMIVGAWGAHSPAALQRLVTRRAGDVIPHLGSYTILGLTKHGHPRHPLYMKGSALPLNPVTLTPMLGPEAVAA